MRKPASPVDRYVGARVKMQRVSLGMSQSKLGEALGVTFQQIQKYENGSNRIAATVLPVLAQTLNATPAYFLPGGEAATQPGFGEPEPQPYLADFATTAEGMQLIKAFAGIRDAKVRKHILDLVASLAQEQERSL